MGIGRRSRSNSPVRPQQQVLNLVQQQVQNALPSPASRNANNAAMSRRSKSRRSPSRMRGDEEDDPEWLGDLLEDIDGAEVVMDSDKGRVNLSLSSFLRLVRRRNTRHRRPPQNYVVSSVVIDGESARDQEAARFKFTFEMYVLTDEWTDVMLLSQDLAVTEMRVEPPPLPASSAAASADAGKGKGPAAATPSYDPLQDGYVAVRHGYYKLFAGRSGRYRVTMSALVPHKTAQRRGVVLELPFSSKNTVTYRVAQPDVLINASPALSSKISTGKDDVTVLEATFPPTNQLNLNWTEKVPEEEQEQAPAEPIHVAAEQHNMISVGESVVVTTVQMSFQITNGTRNLFEIGVNHPHCRILHVTGKHVKRWEVHDPSSTGAAASAPPVKGKDPATSLVSGARSDKRRVLRIFTEYGHEGLYSINFVAEHQMAATSGQVSIPTFDAVNVDREKGYLTVEARTNVEVREMRSGGLGSLDVAELPSTVTRRVVNPILLAYKFVTNDYLLDVEVRKHADIAVLTATIDEAWITATVADPHLVVRYVLKVRNTTTQYVRFNIPRDAEVWSTLVQGDPVKPASDDDGKIMVPLIKNSSETFLVEISYRTDLAPPLKTSGKGKLSVFLPSVDIPINNVFVSLWVPENYTYGDFTGDLREVKHFTGSHPDASGGANRVMKKPMNMMPQVKQRVMMQSNVATFDLEDDLMFDDLNEQLQVQTTDALNQYKSKGPQRHMVSSKKSKSSGYVHGGYGMLPVVVNMPKVGKEFRFQSLVVIGKDLNIHVEYRKASRGFFSRRRVSMCPLQAWLAVPIAGAVAATVLAAALSPQLALLRLA